MKMAVTGGGGYIGSELVKTLVERGDHVTIGIYKKEDMRRNSLSRAPFTSKRKDII
jgi:nucleoside-diphosphate-sugar epimerase